MYCSIHTNIHPMLGCDWHLGTLAPVVPPVPMPHFVAQVLGGIINVEGPSKDVLSHNFLTIKRGSDIGMFIGHVSPSILAILLPLGSGSKCEFGAFSVMTNSTATAVAVGVYVGTNLNCADPIPGASVNAVVAPGTNMANFTLADFGASMLSAAVDIILSAIIDKVIGKLKDGAMAGIMKLASKSSVAKGIVLNVAITNILSGGIVDGMFDNAVNYLVGSPVGSSVHQNAPGNLPGSMVDRGIQNMMNNHYNQGVQIN